MALIELVYISPVCLAISSNFLYIMDIFAFIFFLGIVSSKIASSNANGNAGTFNVLEYGAIGDGYKDDTQAFLKAWNAACSTTNGTPKLVVPKKKTFLLIPAMFSGPCKAKKIDFMISGKIVAPSSPSVWKGRDASQWLGFSGVSGLNVYGSGTIDGQGKGWWDQSCRYHPDLQGCTKLAPTTLKFLSANDISLSNIDFTNSPQTHVLVMGCNRMSVQNVMIQSPGDSPNTDGIHIHASHNISVIQSKIESGDDCISIGDYISNLYISNIECGPGHGISIGSLGLGGNFVQVENIHVKNVSLKGTTNGARIKTYQVGKGYVRNVTFEDIKFDSVDNPIIIDQNYCGVRGTCKELPTGVHISDVTYKGLYGTSTTEVAINLNCSRSVSCTGISLESIKLTSAKAGKQATANCANARGKETGVLPGLCLRN
ncbi:polygalacturonase ADPG1-like [Cornus florida]|uniref:polygalacturonase ADPG1-like n=1 Tax=Cornus florida TaxID=4283 RepID=UPI00289FFDF5|nr:polygalacturonase ADPG1-like [Cornus florida]